jgi:hypothetical protein
MMARITKLPRFAAWLAEQISSVAKAWNRFWFTPADPAPLCLLRLLAGGMLFYSHLVWGLDLQGLLGPNGWNSAELLQFVQRDSWAFSFWWFAPIEWYSTVHIICLVVLGLFWCGCWTRITSILAFVILVSYCNRGQLSDYGLDQISGILAMYLMIGPSGAMYSVDSLLRRRRVAQASLAAGETTIDLRVPRSVSAGLALRLTQVHYCIIYFFAGVSKLQGRSWWTGESMWRAFANYEYQSTDMTWLAAFPWLLQVMTMVVLLWEVSFAYLIWSRHLRPLMLMIGVIMHFGIGACMGMWTFGLMMIFGYVSFCPPPTIRVLMESILERFVSWPPMVVAIDKSETTLKRMAWMKAFDVRDRIQIRFEANSTRPDDIEKFAKETEVLVQSNSLSGATPIELRLSGKETRVLTKNTTAEIRPTVLYVNSDGEVRNVFLQYLKSHGFDVLGAATLSEATELLSIRHVTAIVYSGMITTTSDLEAFHASWKDTESSTVVCYILNKTAARELKPLFVSSDSAVMELPVSLRDVRNRLSELLTAPKIADAESFNTGRREKV